MIQGFVDRFMASREQLRQQFEAQHPTDYEAIVRAVVEVLHDPADYGSIDPTRIHAIDDGDYQGTLVFVIAESSYQPSNYWYVKVSYGSCSGCDTLAALRGYTDDPPTPEQVDGYMTLALHIVQGIKEMGATGEGVA